MGLNDATIVQMHLFIWSYQHVFHVYIVVLLAKGRNKKVDYGWELQIACDDKTLSPALPEHRLLHSLFPSQEKNNL